MGGAAVHLDPKRTAASLFAALWSARAAFAAALLVFLLGFVLGLDPGGGSRSDFYTYHLPAILAFRHGAFTTVLRDYSSATTPLFHILASWSPLLGRDTAFRASSVCFSLLVCGLYILLLRRRFRPSLCWRARRCFCRLTSRARRTGPSPTPCLCCF